jgi:hypothetical protein
MKKIAATLGTTIALIGGLALIPSTAGATHPCGLSTAIVTQGLTYIKIEFWIRNCHSYTVRRKVDIANANDSACYTIGAGNTAHGYNSFPRLNGYVRGLASC